MAHGIDAGALLADIESGLAPAILDVRSRMEYLRGRVPSAVHVPFWLLPWRVSAIPIRREQHVVIYCGHGPRAWFAVRVLEWNGFTRVRVLEGHFSRWRAAGLPEQR